LTYVHHIFPTVTIISIRICLFLITSHDVTSEGKRELKQSRQLDHVI